MPETLTTLKVKGYAASSVGAALGPFQFQRREPGESDIVIDILYCGICHTDIHQTRDEWGGATFPMVPGHEIVGWVSRVGTKVKRFKPGDSAGVGCFVDSCRVCVNCQKGEEQYCEKGSVFTYGSTDKDGKPTYGGYSAQIVVDQNYAIRIPAKQPLERIAPLLCAGITTYSPLKHWKVGAGQKVGVIGLGGLGHMAVKIAAAMGADVTVFSTSAGKASDAKKLGAQNFVVSSEPAALAAQKNKLNFILDTVSAPHAIEPYLEMLVTDGAMVLVGAPPKAHSVQPFQLIGKRRTLAGSLIGGITETQEMIDFCTEKKALADVEVIPVSKINEAFERMMKSDVRYRFVIDLKTL